MITDRTLSDVTEARRIILEKVQNFIELSQAEIAKLERGTLTNNTLNRIEQKQTEIATLLKAIGYHVSVSNKTWTDGDIFRDSDLLRLIQNGENIKNGFFRYDDTENITLSLNYETINKIEKILVNAEDIHDNIVAEYPICGEIIGGEVWV